jgi:hypothetical protein
MFFRNSGPPPRLRNFRIVLFIARKYKRSFAYSMKQKKLIQIVAFWFMAPCSPADDYQRINNFRLKQRNHIFEES